MFYSRDGGVTNITPENVSSVYQVNTTNLAFVRTTYKIWANDTSGNINQSQFVFNITGLNISINDIASVSISATGFVTGHVNLSNGTNITSQAITVYVNGTLQNPSGKKVDDTQADWDKGTFINTTTNSSTAFGNVTLNQTSGNYALNGSFTSQVFDATNNANWNNLTWEGSSRLDITSYLTSALHIGNNITGIYVKDDSFDIIDMKDSNKNFYLNFSDDLINGTVLKIYSKKNKGNLVGIYLQSDTSGNNPLGSFAVNSST